MYPLAFCITCLNHMVSNVIVSVPLTRVTTNAILTLIFYDPRRFVPVKMGFKDLVFVYGTC